MKKAEFESDPDALNTDDVRRKRLLYHFSFWTIAVFMVFGTLYLLRGEVVVGILELGSGLLLIVNFYYLYVKNSIRTASVILLLCAYFMTYVIFISGGVGGTGNLWILFMPLYTMLLVGSAMAWRWLAGYTVLLVGIIIAGYADLYTLHYSLVEVRQTFVVFLIFFILNAINEEINADARQTIEEKNRELERLSTTDHLTGIANRYHASSYLEHETKTARRYDQPLSIIMVDIDHFKQINDRFGHEKGDNVLKSVAAVMQSQLRASDMLGRWGGEEFLIILPSTLIEGAEVIAEILREAVQQTCYDDLPEVTISLGVAQYAMDDTLESLVKKSDDALYRAKAEGRNRTVLAA